MSNDDRYTNFLNPRVTLVGLKRVIVLMGHTASKISRQFELPITGKGVVNMIITDVAVFDMEPARGLPLKELRLGVTLEDVARHDRLRVVQPGRRYGTVRWRGGVTSVFGRITVMTPF